MTPAEPEGDDRAPRLAAASAKASRHGVAMPRGQTPMSGARSGRFGRMFAYLPARDPGPAAIAALVELTRKVTSEDNPAIAAGYTYLGQFIDHDITFDPTSQLQRDNEPPALVNFRSPRFDLDTLYGTGPKDQPFMYEWCCLADRGVKLLLGHNPVHRELACDDLPRNEQERAVIGDPRNDENAIISQLHLLFIRFHNRVVDWVRCEQPGLEGPELFEEARRIVRWHYQWIVVHDFLERIVGKWRARSVLQPGASGAGPTVERRFFTWDGEPSIPVEFSGAAFRFGHSMVRQTYRLAHDRPAAVIFPDLERRQDTPPPEHLGGFRRLRSALIIDWDLYFFDETASPPPGANFSMKIDSRISRRLFFIPPDGDSLPLLNLQRGRALGLPAGRDVARAMGEKPLSARELRLTRLDECLRRAILRATPLWYYILCEAAEEPDNGGHRLGGVGARIVAEVLVGLLEADPQSYLRQWPAWKPELPRADQQDFTMADLVCFAEGRPNSMATDAAGRR